MPPGTKGPEVVGPAVVKGIKANRAHVFTHPEMGDLIQAHQQEVLDDLAFLPTPPSDVESP
jgi:hypothetical protein